MASRLKLFFWTSTPVAIVSTIILLFILDCVHAITYGIICGLLSGIGITVIAKSRIVQKQLEMTLGPDESVIKKGDANHFKGIESVGGRLYLTNERLYFKSHAINIQKHELSIPLNEIRSAEPRMTLYVFPNGIQVTTKDGNKEKFVVWGREEWIAIINGERR